MPAQPQVAPLGPLVAEQIDLDPSITETPALPVSLPILNTAPALGSPAGPLELEPLTSSSQPLIPQLPQEEPRDVELPSEEPQNLEQRNFAPEPEPQPEYPVTKAWAYPAGLIEQLNELAATVPVAADWAERTKAEIDQFVSAQTLADGQTAQSLANLQRLADEARELALAQPEESEARSKLLRAGYAIVRRLAVWEQVHAIAVKGETVSAPVLDREAWLAALSHIDSQLQATGAAANWREYLLIDRARQEFDSSSHPPADQRKLAQDILHRMHSTQLSEDQQAFLKSPPFAALDEQLRVRADELPDLIGLVAAIEEHEHLDTSLHARSVGGQYQALRWSYDPAVAELADTVNTYYRNANIRVALSVELVNRLIPQQQAQVEPVRDNILGADVEGRSHTRTRLRMVLLPDRHRWQIGLEAEGYVNSDTASSKGPATFYQTGDASFRARKRLTVDRRGIRLFNAEANAASHTYLKEFETDFDGIPLLSNVARVVARNQYDSSQYDAKVEVEGRIVGRATSQLDRQVAERLQKAKQDVQAKLVTPLQKLNLEPTAVDLETTADRLIARYRVASAEQISAHTPRPQAPGDSLLSVQVHESMLNNVLEKLNLHGRRIELRELFKEITTRFNREPIPIPEDLPEEVYVTFADEDPVRVDCQEGRVRLTIRLKELDSGRNQWHDFTVRGYYVPNPDQRDANLVRDGVVELIGERLRFGDQVALRAIFARVLSRNRKLNLINKQIAQAPELSDQQVTQFVIHDGWIGIALGPQTPGRQVAMYPRPESESEDDTRNE
ncbi:MAG TPA: hypothetical protein VFV87_12825 [Pirellulaceae bacterium]|nr:hypothetical protein [Pirellulaceae bacterium]